MGQVANVGLTDTFDVWRIRSNQSFTNLFAINPTANVVSANSFSVGSNTSITRANTVFSTHTQITGANTNIRGGSFLVTSNTQINGANTNIQGGSLLVTSNTNFTGTVLIQGVSPGSDDNALAFSIALG
jgi:hypothetical protein